MDNPDNHIFGDNGLCKLCGIPRDGGLTYGIDPASPDGDLAGLSIVKGKNAYVYVGIEAEVLIAWHDAAYRQGCLDTRGQIALDNYHGHTFSDSTDWKGKFEKFIRNNERVIELLEQKKAKEEG